MPAMHLRRLQTTNVPGLADRVYDFSGGDRSVRRWVFLPHEATGAALVKCIALASCGRSQVEAVFRMSRLGGAKRVGTSQLRAELSLHAGQERGTGLPALRVIGWAWIGSTISPLAPAKGSGGLRVTRKPSQMSHGAGWMFAGYGKDLTVRSGREEFDLRTEHRLARFASLFSGKARLTNPLAFLDRLRHQAKFVKFGRKSHVLGRLQEELGNRSLRDPALWARGRRNSGRVSRDPKDPGALADCVVLALTRHLLDACPRFAGPLAQAGVVVLDGVECGCQPDELGDFARRLAQLFPRLQFFLRLSVRCRERTSLFSNTCPTLSCACLPVVRSSTSGRTRCWMR